MRAFITAPAGGAAEGGVVIVLRHVLVALALAAPIAAALAPSLPPAVPEVALGYSLRALSPVEGATAIAFGPDGNLYATTLLGEVRQVQLAWTPAGPAATGIASVASGFSQPLGVVFGPDGAMYVADSTPGVESGRTDGQVTRVDGAGARVVVGGLPNGRHNTNNMVFGPDGRLYIANGNPNDNGIDGGEADVFPYSGAILSVDAAQVSASPAILHWKDASGARIPASQIAGATVNQDFASKVAVLAHGFRNVYDVAFDADGVAWTAMNGADTPDSQDALFRITPDTDYGYPYCFNEGTPGGRDARVVTNPTFPGHDCSGTPPAYALIGWHTCGTGLDHAPAGSPFAAGVYVGECGPFQPDRVLAHSEQDPATASHNTGHKIVRVDDTGVHDFIDGLALPTDVLFGPDGAMYVADADMIYRVAPMLGAPAALSTAPPVQPTILAAPGAWLTQYATPEMATATSVGLAFRNDDIMRHDVQSVAFGPDGEPWCADLPAGHCPLFYTPLLNRGQTAVVQGVAQAPPGTYEFYCSLHTAMRGTLVIAG